MFFLKRLRKDLLLEPHLLGRSLVRHVKDRVHDELEGTCIGRNGYIITIFEIGDEDLETGLVDMDNGALNISVSYLALLFRPFTNEVLDAVVTSASDETGFFSRVGPLVVFVSRYAMPEDISFDSTRYAVLIIVQCHVHFFNDSCDCPVSVFLSLARQWGLLEERRRRHSDQRGVHREAAHTGTHHRSNIHRKSQ
jgi:DNA-directed RNA polymerase subunit E'/Rpb7